MYLICSAGVTQDDLLQQDLASVLMRNPSGAAFCQTESGLIPAPDYLFLWDWIAIISLIREKPTLLFCENLNLHPVWLDSA